MTAPAPLDGRLAALRSAFAELFAREFGWSRGHLAALLNGCVFAPSLLTFWFVNGLLDFSTAFAVGAVASPGGLAVRLLAYLLLVPAFLLLRAGYYLAHPVHRQTVLGGACPQSDVLSLDWFSVGILATGLPLALQDLGPWVGMNATFLVGVFVLPRLVSRGRTRRAIKFAAVAAGVSVFAYAKYGRILAGAVPAVPRPAAVLGPVATLTLSAPTTGLLLEMANSLVTGPVAIAGFALAMNWILTRDEVQDLPMVRHTLPERDPPRLVATSAALGTAFYLGVVAAYAGQVSLLPG